MGQEPLHKGGSSQKVFLDPPKAKKHPISLVTSSGMPLNIELLCIFMGSSSSAGTVVASRNAADWRRIRQQCPSNALLLVASQLVLHILQTLLSSLGQYYNVLMLAVASKRDWQ